LLCQVPIVPENFNFDRVWNPKVYIDNIIGEPKRIFNHQVEYEGEGEAYVVERRRVKGTFMETMELWEFPFDVQVSYIISRYPKVHHAAPVDCDIKS
jgi:hypothetical protein